MSIKKQKLNWSVSSSSSFSLPVQCKFFFFFVQIMVSVFTDINNDLLVHEFPTHCIHAILDCLELAEVLRLQLLSRTWDALVDDPTWFHFLVLLHISANLICC